MKACAACGKSLRPFSLLAHALGDTTGGAMGRPKIEADHGFVCEQCQNTICEACSFKKSEQMGVRAFVCTECGHQPLKTFYH